MTDTVNMAELFARDPRDHSDADIALIIKTLRENRQKFIVDGSVASKPKTAAQAAVTKIDLDIKL